MPDDIAHANAGKAVGFREGAKAQQVFAIDVDVWCCAFRCKFDVGFVEDYRAGFRNSVDELLYIAGGPDAAHGVVRIGEVKEFGIFGFNQL